MVPNAALLAVLLVGCAGPDEAPDGGRPDAGSSPEAGSRDAGVGDAGLDAGLRDAGERDAGERDAGERDAGERDAGPVDAAACELDGGSERFLVQRGGCYARTPVCCSDADCPAPDYFGCDARWSRCRAWFECGCVSDAECPPRTPTHDFFCVTNERVCGVCVRATRCADGSACGDEERCEAGSCEPVTCR